MNKSVPRIPEQQKMGFQDVNKEVTATRGLKLKNKHQEKREKEKKEKEEYLKKFEEKAEQSFKNYTEKEARAVKIVSCYLEMTKDKTLARNKGGIVADLEREARTDLIQLALDQNNDENEQDNGKGSVIVLSVLTKIILLFRDRINDLEFEIQEMKKKNSSRHLKQDGSV